MSIGVGTLQPKVRIRRPVVLAGLVAIVAVFTMSVMGANSTEESARPITAVGRVNADTNANTPTELRYAGSQLSGTVANTPTELSGGVIGGFADVPFAAVPHIPRRADKASIVGGTPTELSGGIADFCHQCR